MCLGIASSLSLEPRELRFGSRFCPTPCPTGELHSGSRASLISYGWAASISFIDFQSARSPLPPIESSLSRITPSPVTGKQLPPCPLLQEVPGTFLLAQLCFSSPSISLQSLKSVPLLLLCFPSSVICRGHSAVAGIIFEVTF